MSAEAPHYWQASDGTRLAWREVGEGHPVVLLHGLFSDAEMNWIKFGHAAIVASAGFRVIMPDLRAHGSSDKPHDPSAYPRGILARDLSEFLDHLELEQFDLGGFSLGARTTVQSVGEGARPRRAVLAGMGLAGLRGWEARQDFFREAIARFDTSRRGDRYWLAIQFMRTMNVDREAAGLLLGSFEDAPDAWLTAFAMPTAVICGEDDEDNGSAAELAASLPDGRYIAVPGTHMSSVTKPELGQEIAAFLKA